MFYYYKKTLAEQGILFCVYQTQNKLTEDEIRKINSIQKELLEDIIIYEGDMPFLAYPIVEMDTIRPATRIELIQRGVQELLVGEVIRNDEIIEIPTPSKVGSYIWDKENEKWNPNEKLLFDGDYIENGVIKHIDYDKSLEYINPSWDKKSKLWIDKSNDEEKLEFYKNKMIEINKDILAYHELGFDSSKLKKSLEKLINLHRELAFEVATIQNTRIR